MKDELGRCLLNERLIESGMDKDDLARILMYKPEKLQDYMDNKRIMPLKAAIHISEVIGCDVKQLYEWKPTR
ncbi:helix-turn-helix domain-containing protein [Paenibacillus sp. GCM10027628]|uniref:helix-turn-helix domain-containing protein n=1 Tax=Paenibacillus sp. GCM10027628 TaxID=3273413 RepID=UPI0036412DAD